MEATGVASTGELSTIMEERAVWRVLHRVHLKQAKLPVKAYFFRIDKMAVGSVDLPSLFLLPFLDIIKTNLSSLNFSLKGSGSAVR